MIKRIFLWLIPLALVAVAAVAVWVWQAMQQLHEPIALEHPQLFEVAPGSSFRTIALRMQDDGLVNRALWLRIWARWHGEARDIKAGEYEITPGASPLDALHQMVAGRVKLWPVQFIEGWTFRDLRKTLDDNPHLDHITRDLSADSIMAALGHSGEHPEGRFFPDTYMVERGRSDLAVLQQAYDRMASVLAQEWANREPDLPYKGPYQALIMASIVEKETGLPSERAQIAGVFVRRLVKGMRLQTDPTVIYGLGKDYNGNLTRHDLDADDPYNTYRRTGLPPTPIAMPGREAVHAALHPAPGKALYFVARGDGSHQFSDTFAEHEKAVRKYQIRQRRKDYRSAPPQSSDAEQGQTP